MCVCARALFLSRAFSHTRTQTHMKTHTHTHTHKHTHTHTHTHTHAHTHTHTHTPSEVPYKREETQKCVPEVHSHLKRCSASAQQLRNVFLNRHVRFKEHIVKSLRTSRTHFQRFILRNVFWYRDVWHSHGPTHKCGMKCTVTCRCVLAP